MIHAFQHVGIGVRDIRRSRAFYEWVLGFRTVLSDQVCVPREIAPLTGGETQMHIVMAMNGGGGGAVELAQHVATSPRECLFPPCWGARGFCELGVVVQNLDAYAARLEREGVTLHTPIIPIASWGAGAGRSVYLQDPDGLWIELTEARREGISRSLGIHHVTLGVEDLEDMARFYAEVLGFTEVEAAFQGEVPALYPLTGDGRAAIDMMILRRPGRSRSALPLKETGRVKLVRTLDGSGRRMFEGRRWGDVGMAEVAFDVSDVGQTFADLQAAGAQVALPVQRVDMGGGTRGAFAYVTDPEGNWIELVQVERMLGVSPRLVKPLLTSYLRLGQYLGFA